MQKNRMKPLEMAVLAGLIFTLLTGAVAAFAGQSAALRGDVLRLHILANSDEAFDQQIKLEVRDAILNAYSDELSGSADKAQAKAQVEMLLPRIEQTAKSVVRESGASYPVRAQVVRMYFETRVYGDVAMPAGTYDAVRITIGEARGHNWWCVLYPPVCISSAADLTALHEDPVAGADPQFEPRFKIVEWLEGRKEKEAPDPPVPDEERAAEPDAVPDK